MAINSRLFVIFFCLVAVQRMGTAFAQDSADAPAPSPAMAVDPPMAEGPDADVPSPLEVTDESVVESLENGVETADGPAESPVADSPSADEGEGADPPAADDDTDITDSVSGLTAGKLAVASVAVCLYFL